MQIYPIPLSLELLFLLNVYLRNLRVSSQRSKPAKTYIPQQTTTSYMQG